MEELIEKGEDGALREASREQGLRLGVKVLPGIINTDTLVGYRCLLEESIPLAITHRHTSAKPNKAYIVRTLGSMVPGFGSAVPAFCADPALICVARA